VPFLFEERQTSSHQQEISVVDMGVSHPGAILAGLVFNSRNTEAFQGDVSLPTFGSPVCKRLRDLDYRTNWLDYSISQGQKIFSSISIYSCRDIYRRRRVGNMVFCKHCRPDARRSGIYAG